MKNLIAILILSIIPYFISADEQYESLQCLDSTVLMGVKRNPNNNNKLVFRTCTWANPWRCDNFPGLAEACPLSCNKCDPSECKDSPFYFRYPLPNGELSGKTRLCTWVATGNTKKKCKRPGVSQICRETCKVCAKQSCYAAYPEEEARYINYRIGDGYCHNFGIYNTPECDEDGGDCAAFNALYPGCPYFWTHEIGNGKCLNNEANSPECLYDGGDCDEFNTLYPDCDFERAYTVGDGECRPSPFNNIEECGYDGGDCLEYNANYPDCDVNGDQMLEMGNGRCEGRFNSEECGYEDGDCVEYNTLYPDCEAKYPYLIGDGICRHSDPSKGYNTPECGYDGGDCL